MSRSRLKSKWMRKVYGVSGNDHHFAEAPKNRVPKRISKYIDQLKVRWLQEPGSFGGHKVHTNGHRMVSGIVRAKKKEELKKIIEEQE